ncbi:MAG TPA: 4Fe-4S dicluster domain-containing protein [Candidatus Limnocylindria bacterium]|nr:4Fe-4S dicluster domain-containing protein [Candidatus Limnocylindria bacterium]
MPRWGMVIDLARCVGCYACTVACKEENGTPANVWFAPVYEREVGTYPTAKRQFLPTLCMHCEDAPCLKACPTGAIAKRDDGIVLIDQDKCCGTRACVAACPYGAITFVDKIETEFDKPTAFEDATARIRPGTSQKCNFGAHRIDKGIFEPACVQSCPTNCRIFGDLDDAESEVSQLIRTRNGKPPREEAGTGPSVFYLK